MSKTRFASLLVMVGVGVTLWTALAVDARASHGSRTTGDEPHYLLTAVSLVEDGDITTGDELDEQKYRPFHEDRLWNQTTPLADGRRVEPHDPLLPAILAAPVAVGGWIAGRLTLAAMAGALAATMLWIAVRRFGVSAGIGAITVLAFSLAMPLSAYATQIYPEMPAALAVAIAIGALTGPFGRRGRAVWLAVVIAMPWLSVKYVPVALVIAALGAVQLSGRHSRRSLVVSLAALTAAGAAYLLAHQVMYGGWTVYAAGDHFADGGQLSVMGYEANYPGRSIRVIGLLVDRHFGLVAWAPIYLLAVPAVAALVRRRPRGWLVLLLPLAAGWLNATFVAQTMHGWWSPGRQLVVVLPCVVIAAAWWVGRVRHVLWPVAALAAVGLVNWMWLVVEASTDRRTLVVDFFQTANPFYRAWSAVLPDGRLDTTTDVFGFVVWSAVLAGLAVVGWRSVADSRPGVSPTISDLKQMEEQTPCPRKQIASVS